VAQRLVNRIGEKLYLPKVVESVQAGSIRKWVKSKVMRNRSLNYVLILFLIFSMAFVCLGAKSSDSNQAEITVEDYTTDPPSQRKLPKLPNGMDYGTPLAPFHLGQHPTNCLDRIQDKNELLLIRKDYSLVVTESGLGDFVRYGFADENGKVVIEPQYKCVGEFREGLAPVCVPSIKGDPQITLYQYSLLLNPTKFPCDTLPSKWGFIDKSGNMVIQAQFADARFFQDGLAAVKNDGKWGFIDKSGKFVIKPQFDEVGEFHKGLATASIDRKTGIIDKSGTFISKPPLHPMVNLKEGLASVQQNGKWGFINKSGKVAIKPQYDKVRRFHEGFAAVQSNGKWGFIDTSGKVVIEPQYKSAGDFDNGCVDGLDVRWHYIDKSGNLTIEPQ